jgi:predicted RNA-binding Zn-ribbon protein involved in translation (DUF1610 family)
MSNIVMPDGSQWLPSTSKEHVKCSSCDNLVDTPEEVASFPDGNCPDCGNSWTGTEARGTVIYVTMPQAISGET